jgi:hypothetical protein
MMVNVLPPVIRQPTANRHDSIGGETAGCEVSSTTRTHGLTGHVMRKIGDQFFKEPCTGGNGGILMQPQLRAMWEKGSRVNLGRCGKAQVRWVLCGPG